MLQYWDTCVNVDDDSFIDIAQLATIDEEAVQVTDEEFSEIAERSVEFYTSKWGIDTYVVGIYPSLEEYQYGFIYDVDKDVHYLFVRAD